MCLIGSHGRYKIIYADACRWVGLLGSWVIEGLSQSQLAITMSALLGPATHRASGWVPRPRSRSAKWGLENNTAYYGQEKKLWVSIAVCLFLPPYVCLSHTTEALTPRRIKRDIFSWPSVVVLPLSFNCFITLLLLARVDLGAMPMKGYSIFPKTPALLEPHHQIV